MQRNYVAAPLRSFRRNIRPVFAPMVHGSMGARQLSVAAELEAEMHTDALDDRRLGLLRRTCSGPQGGLSALRVFHRKSNLHVSFVWACRAA